MRNYATLGLTHYVTICANIWVFNRALLQTLTWTWKTENHTYVVGLNLSEQRLWE